MRAPLIEVRKVSKTYGNNLRALTDLDFNVMPQEFVGLLGDNGAGKSTLVKLLSGINPPSSDQIFANGVAVSLATRQDSAALGIETICQDMELSGYGGGQHAVDLAQHVSGARVA